MEPAAMASTTDVSADVAMVNVTAAPAAALLARLLDTRTRPDAPAASFVEAEPAANDPPMFAELDKVQAELRNLKSDVEIGRAHV